MNLFLDIETIPTQSEAAIAAIVKAVTPPGNISKAETLDAWHADKKPGLIREAVGKTALDGAYGRICCIGWAIDDTEPRTVLADKRAEATMLRHFIEYVDEATASAHHIVPTIIGHNIVGFDIRFLWQRAIVLGVRMPHWFPRDPKPWDDNVFDTMIAFAGARNMIGMSKLCDALGIDVTDEIDGSMVGRLWADGEYAKVASHCRADIVKVREVFNRMQTAFGNTDSAQIILERSRARNAEIIDKILF